MSLTEIEPVETPTLPNTSEAQTPSEALTPGVAALTSLDRLIKLASGEICEDVCEGTHIFSTAPDLRTIIYLINRAIGTPGARKTSKDSAAIMGWQIESTYRKVRHSLQNLGKKQDPLAPDGPFSAVLSEKSIREMACLQQLAAIESRVIEFLPVAIARLKEICAGVIVRKELLNGSERTFNRVPNLRAIRYMASRIEGVNYSVISEIQESEREAAMEPIKRTDAEIKAMNNLEYTVYFNERSEFEYKQASRQKSAALRGAQSPVPHLAAAYKQMVDFMPAAMAHMRRLAAGAVTRFDRGGASTTIQHPPDPSANQFLLNRFAGSPSNRLPLKTEVQLSELPNKESMAFYRDKIREIAKKHHALNTEKLNLLLAQIAGKHQLRLSFYTQ